MDGRKPPEFTVELSADRTNIKDVVKGKYTAYDQKYCLLTV